ncbi:MAG: hypothetical protein KBS60_00775, partial [Phascolarctobacterium sp.]|nr:hypothetical protein [Candidatus Phascolarctobacterium caballi]
KEMFPNENSMERFVCALYEKYNEGQYFKSAVPFEETSIEINQIFDEIYGGELILKKMFTHNSGPIFRTHFCEILYFQNKFFGSFVYKILLFVYKTQDFYQKYEF